MSRTSQRAVLVALFSFIAVGAAFSIGAAKADDVTDDQTLKALTPQKKPLTHSLSTGAPAQSDPAASDMESKTASK